MIHHTLKHFRAIDANQVSSLRIKKKLYKPTISFEELTSNDSSSSMMVFVFAHSPPSYHLPLEYAKLVSECSRMRRVAEETASSSVVWIHKPVGQSQGRGIFLFRVSWFVELPPWLRTRTRGSWVRFWWRNTKK